MNQLDVEQARFNMIEQQIRPWEVLDQRVLDVLAAVPREAFVPDRYQQLAFADVAIPLGHGQVMMKPNLEGRTLQALGLLPHERVLEIGTGSGYLSACLARLAGRVLSVDIFADFTQAAAEKLKSHAIRNVTLATGDAVPGWGENAPGNRFDAIALTGSLPATGMLDRWRQRLNIGGRLFAIVGSAPIMEALLITRAADQEWLSESLFETELPPLLNAAVPARFEF